MKKYIARFINAICAMLESMITPKGTIMMTELTFGDIYMVVECPFTTFAKATFRKEGKRDIVFTIGELDANSSIIGMSDKEIVVSDSNGSHRWDWATFAKGLHFCAA